MKKKPWAVLVGVVVVALSVLAPSNAAAAVDYGPYDITNNATGQCLDANAAYLGGNGAPVQLWNCLGPAQSNQQWIMRAVGYYSEYQIISVANGQCLDAHAAYLGGNGTPVQLWPCLGTGQLNQIWYVYQDGYRNYTFRNKASGRVLDANASQLGRNGTPVQLWDDYGPAQHNQRWRWLDY